jgi:hypothetical protein
VIFFWHTLVYPSTKDKDAERFIQKFVDSGISGYQHVYEDIDRLIEFTNNSGEKAFGKNLCRSDFGRHIREDVRHTLAHIVRKYGASSLEIDNMSQLCHLSIVSRVLRYISRYRIQHTHKLSLDTAHGMDYFVNLKREDFE